LKNHVELVSFVRKENHALVAALPSNYFAMPFLFVQMKSF